MVEIKSDDDQSEETRAKAQFAQDHFRALNQRLREVNPVDLPEPFRGSINHQYIFYLLQPNRYPWWFSRLRDGIFIFDLAMPGETEIDEGDKLVHYPVQQAAALVQEQFGGDPKWIQIKKPNKET